MMNYFLIFLFLLALVYVTNFFLAIIRERFMTNNQKQFPESIVLKNPHHNKCIIAFHGFGVNPGVFNELSRFTHNLGYDFISIHLTGKPWSLFSFHDSNRFEWIKEAEKSLSKLDKKYEDLHFIGFSMGALLAIHAAKKHKPASLILLAPFFGFPKPLDNILSILIKGLSIIPYVFIKNKSYNCGHDIKNTISGYGYTPLKAVQELILLKNQQAYGLKNLFVHTTIFHGKKDGVAGFRVSKQVSQKIKNVQFIPLDQSKHYLMFDKDKNIFYERLEKLLSTKVPGSTTRLF
jgi:esterase/lipase